MIKEIWDLYLGALYVQLLRCFSFIQDVLNCVMEACYAEEAVGQVINIGPDEEITSINELSKEIIQEISQLISNKKNKEIKKKVKAVSYTHLTLPTKRIV